MSRRTPTAAALAGVLLTATAPSALAAPTPTPASTAPLAPTTTASFAPASQRSVTPDDLQWSVSAPAFSRSQVGGTVTLGVTTPATVDCTTVKATLGAKAARGATVTCTGSSVSLTLVVTNAMVGRQAKLSGWSATGAIWAEVTGSLAASGQDTSRSVRVASPDASPTACAGSAPIGPEKVVRRAEDDVMGSSMSTASKGFTNEVWINGVCYPGPHGILLDATVFDEGSGRVGHDVSVSAYDPLTRQVNTLTGTIWVGGSLNATTTSATPSGDFYTYSYFVRHGWGENWDEFWIAPLDGSPRRTLTSPKDVTLGWPRADGTDRWSFLVENQRCTVTFEATDCPGTFS